MTDQRLSERVEQWRRSGEYADFRGRRIHLHRRDGEQPLLLFLHGFPSSSFDWRRLLELESTHALIAFDFLGFGLSDKPRDHLYSLGWQADLAEEMVRRYAHGPVFIVAHDMGTSVATELMARDLAGELDMAVVGALLFNGGILLDRARPTTAQKLLRTRLGGLFARLTTRRYFLHVFRGVFSPQHPLSDDEAADQWALIAHAGGHRLAHRLIYYHDERERLTERWHGAFRDWPKPLSLAWGMLDPVACTDVLTGLRELRPEMPVTELPGVGHYPQIEAPAQLESVLEGALADTWTGRRSRKGSLE